MYYISTLCPACSTGALGFRRCSDGKSIVLLCNECAAVWLQPNTITAESAIFPTGPDYEVAELGCTIASPRADWAVRKEIEAAGWKAFIAGDGNP